MLDFTEIAALLGSSNDLELSLRSLGFRVVESLSPKPPIMGSAVAALSGEIWVRKMGDEYQAVRIDWRGHPASAGPVAGRRARVQLESFPASELGAYLVGPARGVMRYDTRTGEPSSEFAATRAPLRLVR